MNLNYEIDVAPGSDLKLGWEPLTSNKSEIIFHILRDKVLITMLMRSKAVQNVSDHPNCRFISQHQIYGSHSLKATSGKIYRLLWCCCVGNIKQICLKALSLFEKRFRIAYIKSFRCSAFFFKFFKSVPIGDKIYSWCVFKKD